MDHRRYSKRSQEWKDQMDQQEKLLVRPGPTDTAICQCNNSEDAEWIASRLNLASILEQKVYGKTANVELGVKSQTMAQERKITRCWICNQQRDCKSPGVLNANGEMHIVWLCQRCKAASKGWYKPDKKEATS